MKFLPRAVIGGRVAPVEVVHHFGIQVEPGRVDVTHRVHRLEHPVVAPGVGQVILVVTAGGGNHVEGQDAVELVAVVEAQRRAEDHVAQAAVVLRLAIERNLQIHQRHDRMQRQAAAQHRVVTHPDQPWHDGVGAHAKVHRQFAPVVAAQVVGLVVVDEQLAIVARRRHGARHVVFGTQWVRGTAPFGGMGQVGSAEQRGAHGKAKQVRKGRGHRVNLFCCYRSGAHRPPAFGEPGSNVLRCA
ncbi:hypothetical protein D3C80_1285890 [compost metagenome]